MIARYWSATTTKPAEAYRHHFEQVVVPNLRRVPGFRGGYLLEATAGSEGTRFVALTLWESIDAVRAFAGADVTRAHVEPAAEQALTSFDRDATNFSITVRVDAPR